MVNSDKRVTLDEDESFIDKLKKRDSTSYTTLYKQYSIPLFNLAYRITGNVAESEDILQETFIRVYNAIDQFDRRSKLFT